MSISPEYFIEQMRERHPDLSYLNDEDLYIQGTNMYRDIPVLDWKDKGLRTRYQPPQAADTVDNLIKKEYKSKTSENNFLDYLDYGIDEDSSYLARLAYSYSMQGLLDDLMRGEERFSFERQPAIWEEAIATGVSFFMPLDMLTMYTTGGFGGAANLLTKGIQKKAIRKLVGMGMNREIVEKSIQGLVQKNMQFIPFEASKANLRARTAHYRDYVDEETGKSYNIDPLSDEEIWDETFAGGMHGAVLATTMAIPESFLHTYHSKVVNLAKLKGRKPGILSGGKYSMEGKPLRQDLVTKLAGEPGKLTNLVKYTGKFPQFATELTSLNVGSALGSAVVDGHIKSFEELGRDFVALSGMHVTARTIGKSGSKLFFEPGRKYNEVAKERWLETEKVNKLKDSVNKNMSEKSEEQSDSKVEINRNENTKNDNINESDKARQGERFEDSSAHKEIKGVVDDAQKLMDRINDPMGMENTTNVMKRVLDIERKYLEMRALADKYGTRDDVISWDKKMETFQADILKKITEQAEVKTETIDQQFSQARARLQSLKVPEVAVEKGKIKKINELTQEDLPYMEATIEGARPEPTITKAPTKTKPWDKFAEETPTPGLAPEVAKEVSSRIKKIAKLGEKHVRDNPFEEGTTKATNYKYNYDIVRHQMQNRLPEKPTRAGGSAGGYDPSITKISNQLNTFAKFVAEEGYSFETMPDKIVRQYLRRNPSHDTTINFLGEWIGQRLKTAEFAMTPGDVKAAAKTVGLKPDLGFLTDKEAFSVEKNKLTYTPSKQYTKGPITKYISDKLSSLIKKLRGKKPASEEHGKTLFRDTEGKAFSNDVLNAFNDFTFGNKGLKDKARLHRKSIKSWASVKYGSTSKESAAITRLVLHDKPGKIEAAYDKAELRPLADKLVKEFIREVEAGGKEISAKGFYNTKELKAGLDKIAKGKDVVVDVKGKKTTIDKETALGMARYLIETSPRVNEMVPAKVPTIGKKLKLPKIPKLKVVHIKPRKGEKPDPSIPPVSRTIGDTSYRFKKGYGFDESLLPPKAIKFLEKTRKMQLERAQEKGRLKNTKPIKPAPKKPTPSLEKIKKAMSEKDRKAIEDEMERLQSEDKLKGGKKLKFPKKALDELAEPNAYDNIKTTRAKVGMALGKHIIQIGNKEVRLSRTAFKALDKKGGSKRYEKILETLFGKDGLNFQDASVKSLPLGKGKYSLKNLKEGELSELRLFIKNNSDFIDRLSDNPLAVKIGKTIDIRNKHKFPKSETVDLLKRMGIKDGEIRNVKNSETLDALNAIFKGYKDAGAPEWDSSNSLVFAAMKTIHGLPFVGKRAFMPTWYVFRYYMGKEGHEIADRMMDFDISMAREQGRSAEALHNINRLLGRKKVNNLRFIDKELRTQKGRELTPEQMEVIRILDLVNPKTKNKWSSGDKGFEKLTKTEQKYIEAKEWHFRMTDYYWKTTLDAIKDKVSKADYENIKEWMNKKYLKNYMARAVSNPVAKYLARKGMYGNVVLEKIVNDTMEAKAIKAAKEKGDSSTDAYQIEYDKVFKDTNIRDEVLGEAFQILSNNPQRVINNHYKERGIMLDYETEITTWRGKKIKVKSYSPDYNAIMDRYGVVSARYISSIRFFPEFTKIGKKDAKFDISEKLAKLHKAGDVGNYASLSLERLLGIAEKSPGLDKQIWSVLGAGSTLSAALGLSSQTSGVKNVMIGLPRLMGTTGMANSFRGIFSYLGDIEGMESFGRREGLMSLGTKGIGLSEKRLPAPFNKIPLVKHLSMDTVFNWNWMSKTEGFLRIASNIAGRLHFEQLVDAYHGKKNMSMFMSKANIEKIFRDVYKLNRQEMKDATTTPLHILKSSQNQVMWKSLQSKVGHSAHLSTQGGTSTTMLPLWMSSKQAKPFTLFYRMAMSNTADMYINYIKPIKQHHNIMPLARATFAHGLSGAFLWKMYDMLFDVKHPFEQEDNFLRKALSFLWRAEYLQAFSFLLNPYSGNPLYGEKAHLGGIGDNDIDNMNPIRGAAIMRNLEASIVNLRQWNPIAALGKSIGQDWSQIAGEQHKFGGQALDDWLKSTLVIYGQFRKKVAISPELYKHDKIYTHTKEFRTYARRYRNKNGYIESREYKTHPRRPYYRSITDAYYANDKTEFTRAYWSAYNYIVTSLMKDGGQNMKEMDSKARAQIKQSFRSLHPSGLSESYNKVNKEVPEKEFMKYLKPKDRNRYKALKKTFEYRLRILMNNATTKKNVLSWSVLYNR